MSVSGLRSHQRRPGERGAATVVTVLTMFMTMFFVALAVDMGLLTTLRAGAQSGVDIAALAGAQDMAIDPAAVADIKATVKASLNRNLDHPPTDAEMDTCGAEALGSEWSKLSGANCIAMDDEWRRLRVRLPDRTTPGVFSRLFDIDSFSYTAVSVAEVDEISRTLPFWLGSDAASIGCVKSGSLPPDAPCSGHGGASGNYGYSANAQYGSSELGTVQSPPSSATLEDNIAMGLDHRLSRVNQRPHNGLDVLDDAPYPPLPNNVQTETGNMASLAGAGLFSGTGYSDGYDALLTRWDELSWGVPATVGPYELDDEPLWEFIGDLSSSAVPNSCQKDQFIVIGGEADLSNVPVPVATYLTAQYDDGDTKTHYDQDQILTRLMLRCMDHHQGLDFDDNGAMGFSEGPVGCGGPCDPVFTRNDADDPDYDLYDLLYSPRFGYGLKATLPAATVNGTTQLAVDRFSPVFLHRLYAGSCSANRCAFEHSPGLPFDKSTNNLKNVKSASGMSNFVIPDAMLPDVLGSPDGPSVEGVTLMITLRQ